MPKDGDEYHIHEVRSTKPGRRLLRKEACNCPIGRDHTSYESP